MVKHLAGMLYTLLFLDCSGGLVLRLAHREWLLAAAAGCGAVWAGGNAYLWSRR